MAENMKMHRDCDVHEAVNCDINDHKNLEPGLDDCGHRIEAGPGVQGGYKVDIARTNDHGKDAIILGGSIMHDPGHDINNGPGVQGTGDLNIYEIDTNGRKVIVSDTPSHNLDQDVNHGPGVK